MKIGTEYYDSINNDILVQHYLKKSSQIVSNQEYMSMIEKHNEHIKNTPGLQNVNDDALRKRIYETDYVISHGSKFINQSKSLIHKFADEKCNRQVTIIENTSHSQNGVNSNHLSNDKMEVPFLTRIKTKSFYSNKNVVFKIEIR